MNIKGYQDKLVSRSKMFYQKEEKNTAKQKTRVARHKAFLEGLLEEMKHDEQVNIDSSEYIELEGILNRAIDFFNRCPTGKMTLSTKFRELLKRAS